MWLYGSRARGEADPAETHPDRRSDIDMIAILDPRRDVSAFHWDFTPKLIDAVVAEGDSPPYYSLQMIDADWLVDRRRIRSFFFICSPSKRRKHARAPTTKPRPLQPRKPRATSTAPPSSSSP